MFSSLNIEYEFINKSNNEFKQFGGLSLSYDNQSTLLDGTTSSFIKNWYYSIGTISKSYEPQIPSTFLNFSDEVQLFLRIKTDEYINEIFPNLIFLFNNNDNQFTFDFSLCFIFILNDMFKR